MATDRRAPVTGSGTPVLDVRGLNVFYGASHALQGVDLTLLRGVLSVVGRNGMGKTTLCKAIMGLVRASSGSIRFAGEELVGRSPADIGRLGIGYVPQGRRLWRSLTVDEHLQLVASRRGAWTIERVYATFPRLAERRRNGGGQLSGGEQQMLTIARALLLNPRLLIMDEPTEGLAPVIVAQVEDMLIKLAEDGEMSILVIEQNIGVATEISETVAIVVNGRINRLISSRAIAADRDLQQRLLGVGRHGHEDAAAPAETVAPAASSAGEARPRPGPTRIYVSNPKIPTRWSQPVPVAQIEAAARTVTAVAGRMASDREMTRSTAPAASLAEPTVIVAGTLDTKGEELRFVRDLIKAAGLPVRMVDLSTSGKPSGAEVPPIEVALNHPRGSVGIFGGDRGLSVAAMAEAFEVWARRNVAGIAGMIGAGGSGGTSMITPAMRSLPIGVPKIMVSSVASGDVSRYIGPADIMMLYSVTDVQGLNSISRQVLTNAAEAMVGMAAHRRAVARTPQHATPDLPAVGMTMFGVTTPCVQQISAALKNDYDCLVFHATGVGGQAMEKLVDSGLLMGVIDITTTELCDLLYGGVFPATEDRLGAIIRTRIPYVGSVGALDMVNFGPFDTVPERYRGRTLYKHNPSVTLMRTTLEENRQMGRWLGERLNRMEGPVRFFLPENGISALDAPGRPFQDPAARDALFKAIEETVRQTSQRRIIRVPHHLNDPAFAEAVVATFHALHAGRTQRRRAR